MTINALLVSVLVAFVLFLGAIEGYTAVKGIPTISERLQSLGRSAPIVVVIVCTLLGVLLGHFWAQ